MAERIVQVIDSTEQDYSHTGETDTSREAVNAQFAEIIAGIDLAISPETQEALASESFAPSKFGGPSDATNGFGKS